MRIVTQDSVVGLRIVQDSDFFSQVDKICMLKREELEVINTQLQYGIHVCGTYTNQLRSYKTCTQTHPVPVESYMGIIGLITTEATYRTGM